MRKIVDYNNVKYKTRSQVIIDEYESPNLTADQLYLIDKVVRHRGKLGRFGVDHSEILNYELELANKARDAHMNQLVYKETDPYDKAPDGTYIPPDVKLETSQVIFRRLANKGKIEDSENLSILGDEKQKKRTGSARTEETNRNAPSFQQWVRAKDAEKRLKKKLIAEAKREIREELLSYAKDEKSQHDQRVESIDSWLQKKKLNEAYTIA